MSLGSHAAQRVRGPKLSWPGSLAQSASTVPVCVCWVGQGAGGVELVPKAMTRHSIPLSQKEMGSPGDMWGQRHVPQEASGTGQRDGLSWDI